VLAYRTATRGADTLIGLPRILAIVDVLFCSKQLSDLVFGFISTDSGIFRGFIFRQFSNGHS
jgi:hypothetical protein